MFEFFKKTLSLPLIKIENLKVYLFLSYTFLSVVTAVYSHVTNIQLLQFSE